jgi:hypothetical protein
MSKKIRNPVAHALILRKGGVHVKAKSSQRAKIKKNIDKAVDEWTNSKQEGVEI